MSDNSHKNLSTYNRDAERLAKTYNSKSTPELSPDFAREVLKLQGKDNLWALDIGCGSGRDAVWMAEQGFNVVGVDGSADMLEQAKLEKSHRLIQYLLDVAPDLENLKALAKKFDIILMSAFLFHLDVDERQVFYKNLKELTKEGTYVYMTLRHGPVPEGRKMFEVPLEELEELAREQGINFNYLGRKEDPLGREDISWDHVGLSFTGSTDIGPV